MENSQLEIVNKEGIYAIKSEKSTVAVIAYTLDSDGLLHEIGVVTEKNPHFKNGTYTGIIMGTAESEDDSLLARAKMATMEKSGYDVAENNRWNFIEELYVSKFITDPIYCFSVDVTDMESEENTNFNLISLNKAKNMRDSVLLSCFFNLFSKLYKKELTV